MKKEIIVKVNFRDAGKEYKYRIELEEDRITYHNIAVEVAKKITAAVRPLRIQNNGGLCGYNLLMDAFGKKNIRLTTDCTIEDVKQHNFAAAAELQEKEKWRFEDGMMKRLAWRVGKTTSSQLIVETDCTDQNNAVRLHQYLEWMHGYDFALIKTAHGFHIIGEEHLSKQDWIYQNCRVLNPGLMSHQVDDFKTQLITFDNYQKSICENTKDQFSLALKKSKLYHPINDYDFDFDVLYTFCCIRYGKATLRISKKFEGDDYEQII